MRGYKSCAGNPPTPPKPHPPPSRRPSSLSGRRIHCPPCASADSVFGKVIDGFDTLDALERCQVNDKHRPLSEIRLRSVTIHANPLAVRSSSTPTAAAVRVTHAPRPPSPRVAGPNDRLPVRQCGPGYPRVKGYGGQKKGHAAAWRPEGGAGCAAGSEKLRCDSMALAVAAPQPRRRRTGTRRSAMKANHCFVGTLT